MTVKWVKVAGVYLSEDQRGGEGRGGEGRGGEGSVEPERKLEGQQFTKLSRHDDILL
jgi:hypothetical protein